MAKQFITSIRINTSPEVVWDILTDFEKYSEWNPFIKSVIGEVKEGNKIQVRIQKMRFKPTVLSYEKNTELKWLGHLWIKGLFDGEHKFYLTKNPDGTTEFEQSEHFKGILVGLLSKSLDRDTKPGFEQMNEALKIRAEKEQ